ncbi:MAG: hypothetical protein ACPGFA_12640 [Pikeienuella sp.]
MQTRKVFGVICGAACTAFLSFPVAADITKEVINDITILDASIETLDDDNARLRFIISNDGAEAQFLTGVSIDGAAAVQAVYFTSHGKDEPVERLAILPDEEVNFATSHMQVIVPGHGAKNAKMVPFKLIFESGAANAVAHRHYD